MAVNLKVTWVEKTQHPEAGQLITHIGGKSRKFEWKHSYDLAIESLERGLFTYYVEKEARAIRLEVGRASNGSKYLKTESDVADPRILLELPEYPAAAQL